MNKVIISTWSIVEWFLLINPKKISENHNHAKNNGKPFASLVERLIFCISENLLVLLIAAIQEKLYLNVRHYPWPADEICKKFFVRFPKPGSFPVSNYLLSLWNP